MLGRHVPAHVVQEREARLYRPVLQVYERAALALAQMITDDLAAGRFGTAVMRKRQLAAVTRILADMQDRAIPAAAQAIVKAYETGADGAGIAGTYGGVHRQAVARLVENTTHALNELAVQVGRRVEDEYRRLGIHYATQQIARGSTRAEASGELAEGAIASGLAPVVERDGEAYAAFLDRAGRAWRIDKYAEMVIRTTTREAHSAGLVGRLASVGYDLVQVSSHDHVEDVCTEFDGEIFSISGTSSEYPPLTPDVVPPYHPNCVHVLTPGPAG